MYDYVLQLGFDSKTEKSIQEIKNYLKQNHIEDKERIWLPHITVDLYNCNDQNRLIKKIGEIAKNMQPIKLEFQNLNDFRYETLYIEPYNKTHLLDLKEKCNHILKEYRIEKRKNMIYMPHVTLCTNENVKEAYLLANQKFYPFRGTINYLWLYNQKQELIKEYRLES